MQASLRRLRSAAQFLLLLGYACHAADSNNPPQTSVPSGQAGTAGTVSGSAGTGLAAGTGGIDAGGGGNETTGGTSGASGSWLDDSSKWTSIPSSDFTEGDSSAGQAVFPNSDLSPLAWASCGVGCQSSAIGFPAALSLNPAITTVQAGGGTTSIFGVVHELTLDGKARQLYVAYRLEDGLPISALQIRANSSTTACVIGNTTLNPLPLSLGCTSPSNVSTILRGRMDPQSGVVQWAVPPGLSTDYPIAAGFDMDPEGQFWGLGAGAIYRMPSMMQGTWEVIEQPSTGQRGAGRNGLAVWFDRQLVQGQISERLRSWTSTGGVQTLQAGFSLPLAAVDVSTKNIVALQVQEGGVPSNDDIAFWKTPIPDTNGQIQPSVGPVLSLPGIVQSTRRVQSWGDFAATGVGHYGSDGSGGYYIDSTFILVTNLMSWKTWKIKAHPGTFIHVDGFALNNTSVFVTEYEQGLPAYRVTRLIRYELSQLDSIAEVVSP